MSGRAALGTAVAVALLAGCGSSDRPRARIHGQILTIYFSGPRRGDSSVAAAAALNGARLALAHIHARIGSYRIRLRVLDDSTPQSRGWDPNQTTFDARRAAQDPTAIGYLGDFNSGASAISIPLLNRAGIVQISPASTAVGLTTTGPGAAPGEPQKYYPSGVRTFARVVPTDAGQALALVRAEQSVGCQSTFVLEDAEVDGEAAALSFLLTAQSAGLRVAGVQAFQRGAPSYAGLAQSVAGTGADCVVLSAIDEPSAVRLTEQVVRAVPKAMILATDGLADSAFGSPSDGGLPSSLDNRVLVISPVLPQTAYPPAGRAFLSEYARRFGPPPPSAIFGYQAMTLLLGAIDAATDHGRRDAERADVREEVFSGQLVHGAVGTFRIDRWGDTSLRGYGIYAFSAGHLVRWPGRGCCGP
ncbi:MAG TPA: branched-chain amino acid ABC transporter substrate-binding protein [Solirubrobacteraceae bacterium]|nr:branched-chain amino acid ABC transporter substrate-binding protein [Solirubrobacteraceae bacterium]